MVNLEPIPGFYAEREYEDYEKLFLHHATTKDLDILQKDLVDGHEADKQQLNQLEEVEDVNNFQNYARSNSNKFFFLLFDMLWYNPHRKENLFKNKVKEVREEVNRQAQEMIGLIEAKMKEVVKGLSPERIQQFLQFEADESHVGEQCQVCQEEFVVGRLMKQLNCRGRHSFCCDCIDTWFAEHNSCPICRHVFE